jgi:hypothetical protein
MGYQVVFHCGSICIPWEYFRWLYDAIGQQPFDLWDQLNFNEVPLERHLVTQIRRRVRPLRILRLQWNSLEWLLTPKYLFSAAGYTKPKCSRDLDTGGLHVSGINCDLILDTGPIFPNDDFSGTITPGLG